MSQTLHICQQKHSAALTGLSSWLQAGEEWIRKWTKDPSISSEILCESFEILASHKILDLAAYICEEEERHNEGFSLTCLSWFKTLEWPNDNL